MTTLYHPARTVKPARRPFGLGLGLGLGLGRHQSDRLPVRPYSDADYSDYLAGRTAPAVDFAPMSDADADRLAEEANAMNSLEGGFCYA